VRALACGDRALLIETDDPPGLYADLRHEPVDGVEDLVPAARTVLVLLTPSADRARVDAAIASRTGSRAVPSRADEVEIPVTYQGEDLSTVAELTGLTVDEVIARHLGGAYIAAFCGFAPGFAYLTGLDPVLHVPRRATPRVAVPQGAVAIAGRYTSVYPRESPGGWQLIGRTDAPLWSLDRDPPALLVPGTRVRFVRR
jgi:5-oxoprolinase (ATP-hydrolysing) subunit B